MLFPTSDALASITSVWISGQLYFSLFGILREIFKSFSFFLKENSISWKKKPECNKLRSSSVPVNDNSFTARNFMPTNRWKQGSEPELKVWAPAPGIKIFGSDSRTIWSIKNPKPLYYLYNWLFPKTMSVEQEFKVQAPTPALPFKFIWLRLQPSKIAWALVPAPQPWLKDSIYCG